MMKEEDIPTKCKLRKYNSASIEDIAKLDKKLDQENDQIDYHAGQSLPDTSSTPSCPECDSDKVFGIFYGSTPSGGHYDDKGRRISVYSKEFHPCREFAEGLKVQKRIIALDAHIDYKELYRRAARLVQENYDEFMKKGSYDEIKKNGGKYDEVIEAKIMSSYKTIQPMWHCDDCGHNFNN